MAGVGDFERFVLPFVEGAPTPAVEDAVVDSAIEFCTRTRVMRAMLDPVTLVPGMAEYELDPPDGASQITDVTGAWLPEGQILPLTRPRLAELFPAGWRAARAQSTRDVRGFYCRMPGLLELVPALAVQAPRALLLEVAYAPVRNATEVPDLLLNRYAEQIAQGAAARLHQHKAGYADPSRAGPYRVAFDEACVQFADDAARGFATQMQRTGGDEFR